MIRWIALLLAPLAGTGEVRAQAFFGTNPPANGASSTIATGSTTARTLANRAADVVNVKDYGAVCDDTADDTTAINAALTAFRAKLTATSSARLYFPGGMCKITGTLNFTGIRNAGAKIDGAGTTIDAQFSGLPVIDAFNTRWLRVSDLVIQTSNGAIPTIGYQMGIISAQVSDQNVFDNVFISGNFSVATLYNRNAETSLFNHLVAWNTSATGYCLIMDGYNHFNPPSAFQTITAPVDTAFSFNENTFVSPDFRNSGGGPTIWMGHNWRHKYIGGYIGSSGGQAVSLYTEGETNGIMQLDFDVHIETTSVTDAFFITGPFATPVFNGFKYRDHNTQVSNSVFKVDSGISAVIMRDADIQIASYSGGSTLLFDAPSLWTVTGHYYSQVITQFNAPALWEGRLTIGQQERMAYYGAAALSAQMPDSTTTGGNARGANAVDWQTTRSNANQVASGANSVNIGGTGNQAGGQYSVAGGNANFAVGTGNVTFGLGNLLTGNLSSAPGGANANDHGDIGSRLYAPGLFAASGDAQIGSRIFWRSTATTAAVQLTTTNTAAAGNNCANLVNNHAYAFTVNIVAYDHTTPANNESWNGWTGLITRGANAAATVVKTNTAPTPLTNGTVTGSSATLTADTTNGCLNITFTPPTANTDTWRVVAQVDTVEVQ